MPEYTIDIETSGTVSVVGSDGSAASESDLQEFLETEAELTLVGASLMTASPYDLVDSLPPQVRERYLRLRMHCENSYWSETAELISCADEAITENHPEDQVVLYLDYLLSRLETVYSDHGLSVQNKKVDKVTRANTRDRRSRLIAPMGFEYSYHPPHKVPKVSYFGIDINALGGIGLSNDTDGNINAISGNGTGTRPVLSNLNVVTGSRLVTGSSEREQDAMALMPDESSRRPRPVLNRRSRGRSRVDVADMVKSWLDKTVKSGYGYRVYNDSSCVEVCSPVHRSFSSMYEWFGKMHETMLFLKMRTWIRSGGGGGLHVNISYNKELPNWKLAYANFFMVIANHPEINWMFNEPSDNHTARCLAGDHRFIRVVDEMRKNGWQWSDEAWPSLEVCGGKGYAINAKDEHHFELRTFRMVRDISELRDLVDFVNALLVACAEVASWGVFVPFDLELPSKYCSEAEDRGYVMPDDEYLTVYDERMWSAESDFNQLLSWIGLDRNRYKKYARRNYRTRLAAPYGKKYMT